MSFRLTAIVMALFVAGSATAGAQPALRRLATQASPADRAEAARMNSERSSRGLELAFLPTSESVHVDTTRYVIDEHPCGFSVRARLRRIPLRHAVLRPETAVEYAPSGAIRRRWAYPSDMLPVAIEGDALLVAFPEASTALAVRPDGTFEVFPRLAVPQPRAEPCPRLAAFAESAYASCALIPDAATGEARRIAYEGVCS